MQRLGTALVIALLGFGLLVVGLLLGLTGISRDGAACGTAFSPRLPAAGANDDLLAYLAAPGNSGYAEEDCQYATSARSTPAFGMAISGGALLIGGLLVGTVSVVSHRRSSDAF